MTDTIDKTVWTNEALPTKQRMGKGDVEIFHSDRGGLEVRIRNFSDPLLYYARNGYIDTNQLRAGRKCQGLWFLSGMRSQYSISKYTDMPGGGNDFVSLAESQQAYGMAMDAVDGLLERKVCFSVCCMGEKAGRTGRAGNLQYLKRALDNLVVYFGYDK